MKTSKLKHNHDSNAVGRGPPHHRHIHTKTQEVWGNMKSFDGVVVLMSQGASSEMYNTLEYWDYGRTDMLQYMVHKIPLFVVPCEWDGLATSPTSSCHHVSQHPDNTIE